MRGGNLLRQFVDFKNVVFFNCVEQQPSASVVTAAKFAPEGFEGGIPRIKDSLFALLASFFGSLPRRFSDKNQALSFSENRKMPTMQPKDS